MHKYGVPIFKIKMLRVMKPEYPPSLLPKNNDTIG